MAETAAEFAAPASRELHASASCSPADVKTATQSTATTTTRPRYRAVPDRSHRGRARGCGDDVLVGHDGSAQGHQVREPEAGRRRTDGRARRVQGDVRHRRELHLPVARAAVPLGAAAVLHRRDAHRRYRDHHGALRPRRTRSRRSSKYRVTHSQWVPTMFVRMLKLPDGVREKYDVSSQQLAIHAAAPCPIPVKQQMIEWWGPIIIEYYGATEGGGATMISVGGVARASRIGRASRSCRRCTSSTKTGNECAVGETGDRVVRGRRTRAEVRLLQGPREDEVGSQHARAGTPSATWATSTTRATSTSPTAATS